MGCRPRRCLRKPRRFLVCLTAVRVLAAGLGLAACQVPNPAYDPTASDGDAGPNIDGPQDMGGRAVERDAFGDDPSLPLASEALVAYFPFEDPVNSTTFADKSRYGNDARLKGEACSCMSAPGRYGRALAFSQAPSDQNVGLALASSPSLESTDRAMTISAWVYLRDTEPRFYSIVSRQCGDSPDESVNLTIEYPRVSVLANCNGHSDIHLVAPPQARVAEWLHVAMTFDGKTVRLFVAGVLTGSATTIEDHLGHDEMNPFVIGNNFNGTDPPEPFTGLLDDVAIWKRALSQAEISSLSRNASPLEF